MNSQPISEFARSFPTAFVTGGSSGLGKMFVDQLLAEGVEVWATSRKADGIAERDGLHAVQLDLCQAGELEALLQNPPWGDRIPALLINNAGYGIFSRWADVHPRDVESQIAAMLGSPARLSQYFLQGRASEGAAIVQISSLAVEFPLPYFHGYNLVKSGLSGLARSLMLEYPGGGRSASFVIDFRPGDFRTGFNQATRRSQDSSLDNLWKALDEHLQKGAAPSIAWKDLRKSLLKKRSATVRTGTFFQAKMAPLLARFFPDSWVRWAHRRYYSL